MTAKEELSQFKYIRKRVDEALEEYEKYKDRATKITSVLSDMPKGRKRIRQSSRQRSKDGRLKQRVC